MENGSESVGTGTASLRTSSVSEFLFSDERWSLVSFNSVPHLADPGMITYR